MERTLPRLRPGCVPEQGIVVALHQPVMARPLLVTPAAGQVGGRIDRFVMNGAVVSRGPDNRVVAAFQRLKKRV